MKIYMIPDWQHNANLKRMNELKEKGYIFKINSDMYQVWYKEEYLGGAGVMLPRRSDVRRTWMHKKADVRDYTQAALSYAEAKEKQLSNEKEDKHA